MRVDDEFGYPFRGHSCFKKMPIFSLNIQSVAYYYVIRYKSAGSRNLSNFWDVTSYHLVFEDLIKLGASLKPTIQVLRRFKLYCDNIVSICSCAHVAMRLHGQCIIVWGPFTVCYSTINFLCGPLEMLVSSSGVQKGCSNI